MGLSGERRDVYRKIDDSRPGEGNRRHSSDAEYISLSQDTRIHCRQGRRTARSRRQPFAFNCVRVEADTRRRIACRGLSQGMEDRGVKILNVLQRLKA